MFKKSTVTNKPEKLLFITTESHNDGCDEKVYEE